MNPNNAGSEDKYERQSNVLIIWVATPSQECEKETVNFILESAKLIYHENKSHVSKGQPLTAPGRRTHGKAVFTGR